MRLTRRFDDGAGVRNAGRPTAEAGDGLVNAETMLADVAKCIKG